MTARFTFADAVDIAVSPYTRPAYQGDRVEHPLLGDRTFERDCYEAEKAYWAERGIEWPASLYEKHKAANDDRPALSDQGEGNDG